MKNYNTLFLIDGDNNIFKGLNGIEQRCDGDKVLIFITQPGLIKKLKKYLDSSVNIILVKSGTDSVDNRIKGKLGNLLKSGQCGRVFIISGDHGYSSLVEKYRKKYAIEIDCLAVGKSIARFVVSTSRKSK